MRPTLRLAAAAVLLLSPMAAQAAPEGEAMIEVQVDHARVVKITEPAETIIIGNPSIVDVAVHDSRTLILTGRSFGITNLIVLDRDGQPMLDEPVSVRSFEDKTVRVFRQASRTTYACTPTCQSTVTIGDDDTGFKTANGQFQARQTMISGAN